MYKKVIVCLSFCYALLGHAVSADELVSVVEHPRWKFIPAAAGACDFLLSNSGSSLFIQTEVRAGHLGFFQNMQTGQVVRLRDNFSNLAYVVHADVNRGFAVINDRGVLYSFDFKTLQVSALEGSMRDAFQLRRKATSPNGQYFLSAESQKIAIRNFDSQEEVTDIHLKLPKDTSILAGNKISDSGKTIAIQIADYVHGNTKNFKTQVLSFSDAPGKKPKISTLPGQIIYLSADGGLLITDTGKREYNVYSISNFGEIGPVQLQGLKEAVHRLWKIADPNGDSSWANDVRIRKGKISENGWWLVLDFEFAVKSNPQVFSNGSQIQQGTTAGLVLRWDLQSPNSPPWISQPIAERYYDYLISKDGTLIFAAVDDKHFGNLTMWTSNHPEQRKKLSFREQVSSMKNGNPAVFNLRFSELDRRMLLEMDNGLLVMNLPND